MTDNEQIKVFMPIIVNGLTAQNYVGVSVKQNNQPTMQGANSNPTVYFFKVADKRYGFLYREDVWDTVTSTFTHSEIQQYETTWRISALVTLNPKITTSYTSADLANEVAAIMQSDSARAILLQNNIGILRVTNVVNPYFTNDKDQYQAMAAFDFVLTHEQTRVTTSPVLSSYELNINRV